MKLTEDSFKQEIFTMLRAARAPAPTPTTPKISALPRFVMKKKKPEESEMPFMRNI
jgi:hypothetical protein